jgi:hypothetical protein
LHSIPWEDIRFKRNVDEMWQLWKTFFVQVVDKHVPISVKRLRKRGNVPWVNSEVKEKLFKIDALKRKAIKTNKEDDWNYIGLLEMLLMQPCAVLKMIIMHIYLQINRTLDICMENN